MSDASSAAISAVRRDWAAEHREMYLKSGGAQGHIMDITAALIGGRQFPPLIAAHDIDDSLVLVEGHARATAYTMLRRTRGLEAFVARSPDLPQWKYY